MRNIFLIIITLIFCSGCQTTTPRSNVAFDTFFKTSKTVAVLPLDFKMFKFTAGGLDQYRHDWSLQAENSMKSALKDKSEDFQNINFDFMDTTHISLDEQKFIADQRSFFYVSSYSIVKHTYDPVTTFKHKVKNFDYTMGKEFSAIKKWTKADAILFVSGRNYIWTSGRTSLAVLGGFVSAATGVYIRVPAGDEWIVASLVDVNTGEILWFNYIPMPGDMRKEAIAKKIVRKLFKDFPQE